MSDGLRQDRADTAARIAALHERLLSAYGCGRETFAREITEIAAPFADEVKINALNEAVVTLRRGDGPVTLVYAGGNPAPANIAGIGKNGLLYIDGFDGDVAPGAEIAVGTAEGKSFAGVLGEETDKESGERLVTADIGAASAEEALRQVSVGDPVILSGKPEPSGVADSVIAPYVYGFGGKLVMLEALFSLPVSGARGEIVFVFPTGQSRSAQSMQAAVKSVEPRRVLIAGSVRARDGWTSGKHIDFSRNIAPSTGAGAALVLRGAYSVADRDFSQRIRALASKKNIPLQIVAQAGRFPGIGEFHEAGHDAALAALALPVRYETALAGVYDAGDVVRTAELLNAVLLSGEGL
ncbi:MAG: hypothetical protein LBC58_06510 [Clostridiales Family XIII bacterium]|jgi:putative aminopeptidase FrvX|nr:hypothetical protein [Clostridiales Family XIII bacterium]